MSLTIVPDSPVSLTVAVPQPNSYALSTAEIIVSRAGGQSIRRASVSSFTDTSLTFNFTVSKSQAKPLYDCGKCQPVPGRYVVVIYQGATPLDPPSKTIASGSVSYSGPAPCLDCGGSDPDPEQPPPGGGGGGDNPYGPVDPSDELVPLPSAPGQVCLPPNFIAPAPTVPRPCD